MSSPSETTRGRIVLAAEIGPDPADAGAELFVDLHAECDPRCNLAGWRVLVSDGGGAQIGGSAFETSGDGENVASLVLKAPDAPGEYRWEVVLPALTQDGVPYMESSAPLSFSVRPHETHLTVWDIPTAIVAGETFGVKIGAKCSSACDLAGGAYSIADHEGLHRASGNLSGAISPGTDGLYFADVELTAPEEEGLYRWSARVDAAGAPLPHDEGSHRFGVRVVRAPECALTVEAKARTDGRLLRGARVTLHPYHAVADHNGVARLEIAKGAYRLFVAQKGYLNFARDLEIAGDTVLEAELEIEVKPERN